MKHLLYATAATCLATPLAAQDLATKDEILAALSGNTVQGSMADGATYMEFYDADGTIKAPNYDGHWGMVGNQMCFAYGKDHAACWFVLLDGAAVTWVREGKVDGTGTILPGNPNKY